MEMMKNEWKKLAGNKLLLISFVVIMFIPILYAGFFLKSVWDPYGKTGELPVAVVNLDESVDYQGKTLDVGDQLVENLKKNDLLDWHFVSEKAAKEGIKDRKYYMVVTLPKNFSKNASTLLDKEPKKMNITYETNGSLNYIGEVIGETAAKQLKSEVSANVTKAYAESIFGQIEKVGDGFTQAADGSKKLDDGTKQLTDGNKQITENLQKLASSTVTFSEGAEKLEVGLNQYTDGVAQLDSGATKLNDGIGQLASNVGPLQAGVGQLSDGSQTLANGVGAYTAGVGQLADGSQSAVAGSQTLANGLGALNVQIPTLSNGISSLNGGQKDLNSGINKLLAGSKSLEAGLTQLDSSITATDPNQPIGHLKLGLDQMKDGMEKLNGQVNGPDLIAKIDQLETQLGVVSENLKKLGATISPENPDNNEAQVIKIIQSSPNVDDTKKAALIAEIQPTLVKQGEQQGAYLATIKEALKSLSPDGQPTIRQQVEALQFGVTQLYNGYNGQAGLYNGVYQVFDTVHLAINNPNATADKPSLLLGARSLEQGLASAQDGSNQLVDGTNKLNSKVPTLASGVSQLSQGGTALADGISKINGGASQLNANSSALNSGANALNGGIGQISGKLPDLISGVTQLNDGSSQLAQGTAKLTENSPQLNSGIGQLADGSTQIQSGSSQLADGSGTLGTGLGTLKDGTKELSSKLKDGAKEVNGITATDKTFDMLASPDKLTHKEYSHVENYGAALAPYVLSLALYVGALVFNFIFPIRKISMTGQSSFSWWLSKFSIGLVAAVAMAVVEAGLILALGLHVESVAQFMTMAIVTSIAYMFLIMTLAMTFDNPGRFIGMVLLIVQLGGAGGTFPIPLTNNFFKAIHPYLPMSHSIYGFREAISGGLGQGVFVSSALILLAIFVVFSGLLFLSMNWLQKRHLDDVSQLDDNQKLQALED